MKRKIELSVIIPVTEKKRCDDIKELHVNYTRSLEKLGKNYETIYVIDGDFRKVFNDLKELKQNGENLRIIKLAKSFGESTALSVGFEQSSGEIILTLPAYQQMEANEIPGIVKALNGYDMVIGRRWPRIDNFMNRLQSNIFHRFVQYITGLNFHDLGSGIRVLRRKVMEEVQIYGDQHRFLPLLATRYGFKVTEVNVKQSPKDVFRRIYSPGIYIRRFLDFLSVFFLIKFTKKPLRFFGLLGLFVFSIGAIISFYLLIQRLFFHVGLADRPMVLVGLLLIVLGIQIIAIGLIGEIIIFTHAKELKEYTIEKIIN